MYLKNVVSFDPIYEYPDEDFCLFNYFYTNQLLFPIIMPGTKLKCTCTLYFLEQNPRLHSDLLNSNDDYNFNYKAQFSGSSMSTYFFCDEHFNATQCEFDALFSKCLANLKTKINTKNAMNDVDFYFQLKWLQYILFTIIQPVLSILGKKILFLLEFKNV